jgi:ABC-type proline/glycine betaine transport system ATPase subunit
MCGNEVIKGLSGGQRKRVSVGLELLTNPAVLFLDEPTSGLDSKVAEDVVRLLQGIAKSGRIVICTTHQPNFQVFNLFTRLLMLSKGRVVYDYKVPELSNYLADGFLTPTPSFINPVDHFMSILAGDVSISASSDSDSGIEKIKVVKSPDKLAEEFCDKFRRYATDKNILPEPYDESGRRASLTKPSITGARMAAFDGEITESEVSTLQKFTAICRRVLLTVRRDKKQMTARIFQQIFIGLILGSIYFQMPNTQDRIMDRQSALFIILLFTAMTTIMQSVTTMPVEKAILLREHRNGYYGTNVFFARMLVILTLQILYSLLHCVIVYPMIGLYPEADRFFIFFAALSLAGITGSALGFAVCTLVPTIEAAVAIVSSIKIDTNICVHCDSISFLTDYFEKSRCQSRSCL